MRTVSSLSILDATLNGGSIVTVPSGSSTIPISVTTLTLNGGKIDGRGSFDISGTSIIGTTQLNLVNGVMLRTIGPVSVSGTGGIKMDGDASWLLRRFVKGWLCVCGIVFEFKINMNLLMSVFTQILTHT